MHEMIGSAGMLRGWAAIWTMQMLWFFATATVCVGVIAMAELVITARARRTQARVTALVATTAIGGHEQPLG